MRKYKNLMLLGTLMTSACMAPLAAQANPIVTMELTGLNVASLNGVYTEPYNAQIGSMPAAVYCDDFYDDVNVGQVWQATVTNMGALSTTSLDTTLMFHGTTAATQATNYMAAAWLAEQIAGQNQHLATGQLTAEQESYALWYVFDPDSLVGLSTADYNAAITDYNDALAAVADDTPGDFSKVNIYTPLDDTPGSAGSQEYLSVDAPEPGTLGLMAVGLAGLCWMARRRRQTQSV